MCKTLSNEQIKAYEFAVDFSKLLITLSTGVLALAITFIDKFTGTELTTFQTVILLSSFFCFSFSALFGFLSISGLIASLSKPTPQTIWKGLGAPMCTIQSIAFLVGILLMFLFVIVSILIR